MISLNHGKEQFNIYKFLISTSIWLTVNESLYISLLLGKYLINIVAINSKKSSIEITIRNSYMFWGNNSHWYPLTIDSISEVIERRRDFSSFWKVVLSDDEGKL